VADQFDVIVVGARVAGSPLAAHLARAGLSVCLLDRAKFPSDTLSTHIIQDLGALRRLGVLDRLLATGAPLLSEVTFGADDVVVEGSFPDLAFLCVRRPTLDQVLLDNAAEAGADVRTRTWVTGLVEDGGRVAGVHTRDAGGVVTTLRAPVVVGADGRNSIVAKLVGARRYNVTESERAGVWAYYEGVEPTARANFRRSGRDIWAWCSTDGGAFIAIYVPPRDVAASLRDGDGAGFDRRVEAFAPLAGVVAGARRIRKPVVVGRWEGYFRESSGPGWALVGDAGHFKDPTPGIGISDALRQAERLASFLTAGFREERLDEQLRAYWSWRDQEAAEPYWFAHDLGRATVMPPVVAAMFGRLLAKPGGLRTVVEVLHRRRQPSKMFGAADLLGACGRLIARRNLPARQVLAEVRGMRRLDRQRKQLMAQPRFEEGEAGLQPDDDLLEAGV
jgi:flavin-dependent dehydrogenase